MIEGVLLVAWAAYVTWLVVDPVPAVMFGTVVGVVGAWLLWYWMHTWEEHAWSQKKWAFWRLLWRRLLARLLARNLP